MITFRVTLSTPLCTFVYVAHVDADEINSIQGEFSRCHVMVAILFTTQKNLINITVGCRVSMVVEIDG